MSSGIGCANLPDHYDPNPEIKELLDRITHYYPKGIDPDLTRTRRLMNDLGNPHLKLPPVIHVAGTNGKGSIIAYARAMAEQAGLSCHVMTSPHLVRFNERFVVGGAQIGDQDLIKAFEEVETINDGRDITAFELITAVGFYLFAQHKADITLLEVGMGGRLDATNVILNPIVSIISVISRDHTKFLGETYAEIAAEKAGIIKPHCAVVVAPQRHAEVFDVIQSMAHDRNAPLWRHGFEWSFDPLPERILLHEGGDLWPIPYPNLTGEHQWGNAATSALAMKLFSQQTGIPIPHRDMEQGIGQARWPGRLQKLSRGPLVDQLQQNGAASHWELWIDGGHNDSCGEVLAQQLKIWRTQDPSPVYLILGMITTKEPAEFLADLTAHCAAIYTIPIPHQDLSFTADQLAEKIHALSARTALPPIFPCENAAEAIAHSLKTHTAQHPPTNAGAPICSLPSSPSSLSSPKILITGSLYLMGHILENHD